MTLPERVQNLVACLEKNESFQIAKIERNLSISKCLNAPLLINQKANEEELSFSIFLIIKRFNDLVNVGKKMNEDQMITLASDLFEKFGSESLDDVLLFFKMARSGEFGDFYRLDSTVVLSWLPKYFDRKIQAREDEIQNQRNLRQRAENDAVAAHVPDDIAKKKLEQLSQMLQKTTISKNTGVLRKDNPLFNYKSYLEQLPEAAQKMDAKQLKTMYENTSSRSHPEVYKILRAEIEKRNKKPEK